MKPRAAALIAAAPIALAFALSACERAKPLGPDPVAPNTAAASQGPATPARPPTWIEWRADKDGGPRSYQAGPFTVTLTKQASEAGLRPHLAISDGKGAPLNLPGSGGSMTTAQAEFTAAALDRQSEGQQLLVRTYTYGAHCCFAYQLVERQETSRGAQWIVHDLGQFDGAGMPTPKDVDGDGRLELLGGDQRFLYAFAAYAFSAVPPQVWELVGGKLVDVSAARRYRPAFEADAPSARALCAERREPGSCLAYAATMARLGRLSEAWPLIDAADPGAKDPSAAMECWGGRTLCLDDREIPVASFRDKVERFLEHLDYLPAQEAVR